MNIKHLIITVAILLVVTAVFGAGSYALNLYTGPIIADRNAGAANERLDAVMPEGDKAYEDITATLTLPEKFVSPANNKRTAEVIAVHKEVNGLGYVVEVAWTSEDSHGNEPNLVLVGISTDGKIIKINNEAYHDTDNYNIFNKDPNYTTSFEGQDSTLADVGLVAGSTHSSESFRSAVAHAFEVLVINDMITAGKKSDSQILAEMLPSVHTGLTSGGSLKAESIEATGNIVEGYKALNGSGYAFIVNSGEAQVLAVVNAANVCKVYDVTGADVTDANATVVAEVLAVTGDAVDYSAAVNKTITAKFADATDITAIEITTFSNVVYACSFVSGDATYYAFYSCPLTFEDSAMAVCTIIDTNGAIASQSVQQFVFGHSLEYVPVIKDYVDLSGQAFKNYIEKYAGLTGEELTDDLLIAKATMSSSAVKLGTKEAFDIYNLIKGGAQ